MFANQPISLLPFAVKYADLAFLKILFPPREPYNDLNDDIRFKSLKYAYEKENKETVAFLLSLYPCGVNTTRFAKVLEALKKGEDLDFGAIHKLIEILALPFEEPILSQKIQKLFGQRKARDQAVIVPNGELPNLERLAQKTSKTNFTLRPKKGNTAQLSIIYREANGTKHEIDIDSEIDQSGDSKSITYFHEGIETKNINELILRTSLAERIFSSYPQQFIAVTKELAALPYEQQPWFRGIIPYQARKILASDAPSQTIFFTFHRSNEIWIAFSTPIGSRKLHHEIKIQGGSILDYLPKDKFVLGLHNGGEISGLEEHFVRRAVQDGDFKMFKQLLDKYNLDLKTNVYFDDMLWSYLSATKKELINNDMVMFLIKNDVPLVKDGFSCVVTKCNDDVIKFAAEKGYNVNGQSIEALMERGSRYDTLTACWESYLMTASTRESYSIKFFEELSKKKFSEETFKIRTLVMMAWKFDQHCLFRQLPKEIMMEILSYEYIDEPPYWDVLRMVAETAHEPFVFNQTCALKLFPFVWKYWDSPEFSLTKDLLRRAIYFLSYIKLPDVLPSCNSKAEIYFKWTLKFLQKWHNLPETSPSYLTRYCLIAKSSHALAIFKLLLDKNITDRQSLHAIDWYYLTGLVSEYLPAIFLPFLVENKPMIELLIDNDLFEETIANNKRRVSLKEFLQQKFPQNLYLLDYANEYRAKKLTNKN